MAQTPDPRRCEPRYNLGSHGNRPVRGGFLARLKCFDEDFVREQRWCRCTVVSVDQGFIRTVGVGSAPAGTAWFYHTRNKALPLKDNMEILQKGDVDRHGNVQ